MELIPCGNDRLACKERVGHCAERESRVLLHGTVGERITPSICLYREELLFVVFIERERERVVLRETLEYYLKCTI